MIAKKITIKKPDISFPDADTDFSTGTGRDEIVNYLIDKYSQDCVAFVGNRNSYGPKSVIRDLGQVYEISPFESIACTKGYNDSLSVKENMKLNESIKHYFNKYPELIDKVDKIVGVISSLGIHAGGVVISDKQYPLTKYCALQRPNEDGRVATLWTKGELQDIGLIKYDILGLTTAGQNHLIKEMVGLDPYTPFREDDVEVYRDIVLNVRHRNIFQFETELGKRAFKDLMPMSFMELANASGIIRIVGTEGGRQIYKDYSEIVGYVHQGDKNYWIDKLREDIYEDKNFEACKKVLKDSYGILIYQEQLAYLVKELSEGKKTFTDGNKVRKLFENQNENGNIDALQGSKKELKVWHESFMKVMEEYFLPYLGQDGWDSPDQNIQDFLHFKLDFEDKLPIPRFGIIKWLISSTAYLFSKLHAVAYTQNTYDAMYLKHYYPLEFWTGSLIYEKGDLDKITSYINAINLEDEVKVLAPNINDSFETFSKISDTEISYGLSSIMNVAESAKEIVIARNKKRKFKSIDDFCTRVDKKVLNKRVIEALLFSSAFSDFGTIEEVAKQLRNHTTIKVDDNISITDLSILETKYLGVALTNIHPLIKEAIAYTPITDVEEGTSYSVAVNILEIKNKVTKKNKPYTMLKCRCLNSLETFNLFDWENNEMGFEKGTYRVLNIVKNGDFYGLKMSKSYQDKFYKKKEPFSVTKLTKKQLKASIA